MNSFVFKANAEVEKNGCRCAKTSLIPKLNVTDLTINQPLRGGFGGQASPPMGVWGNPQVRVFFNTCNFRLKPVPLSLNCCMTWLTPLRSLLIHDAIRALAFAQRSEGKLTVGIASNFLIPPH
jgi:hypothetical protein